MLACAFIALAYYLISETCDIWTGKWLDTKTVQGMISRITVFIIGVLGEVALAKFIF